MEIFKNKAFYLNFLSYIKYKSRYFFGGGLVYYIDNGTQLVVS